MTHYSSSRLREDFQKEARIGMSVESDGSSYIFRGFVPCKYMIDCKNCEGRIELYNPRTDKTVFACDTLRKGSHGMIKLRWCRIQLPDELFEF